MTKAPDFDVAAAHKYFAAYCFNKGWELMEKPDRTAEEARLMFALNQASIFHWLNRPDCDNQCLSIGYWQAARMQALLGNALEARRYAEVCLSYSGGLEAFYLGYAYEALARAAVMAGDRDSAVSYLAQAKAQAALVTRKEDRDLLIADLEGLE